MDRDLDIGLDMLTDLLMDILMDMLIDMGMDTGMGSRIDRRMDTGMDTGIGMRIDTGINTRMDSRTHPLRPQVRGKPRTPLPQVPGVAAITKTPDYAYLPKGARYPTVVFEVGWTEGPTVFDPYPILASFPGSKRWFAANTPARQPSHHLSQPISPRLDVGIALYEYHSFH